MTIRRKAISAALIIISFICLLFVPITGLDVIAEETPTRAYLSASDQTVHRGQTFDVDINISDNQGILTLFLTVKFDHSVFKLIDVRQRSALASLNMEHSGSGYNYIDDRTGGFNLFWDGSKQDKSNGTIVTLTFESNLQADLGTYPITVEVSDKSTTSAYKVPAKVEMSSPSITLIAGKFIVVWHDYDGTNLTENPTNMLTGGIEYQDGDLPSNPASPSRTEDEKYSYRFKGWKGGVWNGPVPEGSSVLYYVADYEFIPKQYAVFYYVDGFGDENDPDGEITDTEYFTAKLTAYSTTVDTEVIPYKRNYTFYGWYLDKGFTQRALYPTMPAENITLYGYFKYNIRENDIPTIELKYRETVKNSGNEDIAYVDVFVRNNYGLSSLMLTVDKYDKNALQLCGYELGEIFKGMSFFATSTEHGYIDNFKFSWNNSQVNSYETGRLLTLQFKVNELVTAGAYEINMTYDESSDATYVNIQGEIWYSKIKFVNTKIPVGSRNHWNEDVEDIDVDVDISSDKPLSYGVELNVELLNDKVENEEIITKEEQKIALGNKYEVYDLYEVYFTLNGDKVSVDDIKRALETGDVTLTVKIKLTEKQLKSEHLFLYYVDETGKMELYDSRVEGEYIVYTTDHLSYWAVVGDKIKQNTLADDLNFTATMTLFGILLVIVTSLLTSMIIRYRNQKTLFPNLGDYSFSKEEDTENKIKG